MALGLKGGTSSLGSRCCHLPLLFLCSTHVFGKGPSKKLLGFRTVVACLGGWVLRVLRFTRMT